jgi:hypothetical protein
VYKGNAQAVTWRGSEDLRSDPLGDWGKHGADFMSEVYELGDGGVVRRLSPVRCPDEVSELQEAC